MPTNAITMPTSCHRPGRSPSSSAAKPMVNTAWLWITSEARPAGRPRWMARNSSPNWRAPIETPTASTQRHRTRGRPMNSTAGTAATRKRMAVNSSGGEGPPPRRRPKKHPRRHGGDEEADGGEQQRREGLQADVDGDEVGAPDEGDGDRREQVTRVHAVQPRRAVS